MGEVKRERNSFKGTIGFILAAAGSAVGLGNIWRFPYLAAKDGGGLFLVVYIALALTFGFCLLTTEIAIGRKTKQSALMAYGSLKKGWKPLGIVASAVTPIIFPYYCVIGGWVLKYFIVFLTGGGADAAADGYFTGFITTEIEPIVYMAIFLVIVAVLVFLGVKKGIESSSKILMPILIVLVVVIAVYSLTVRHTDADGATRTGLEGLKIFVVPDFTDMTFGKFINVVIDAMGQLFFSLSVAMGIMITYGSYVSDEANLVKSIKQIEFFDTAVAFLAGAMIIPAVYTFMGQEGLDASGPSLMFISLPKVFLSMGGVGRFIGTIFFLMVLFAAVTSAVSVMETVVSNLDDQFRIGRAKATRLSTLLRIARPFAVPSISARIARPVISSYIVQMLLYRAEKDAGAFLDRRLGIGADLRQTLKFLLYTEKGGNVKEKKGEKNHIITGGGGRLCAFFIERGEFFKDSL